MEDSFQGSGPLGAETYIYVKGDLNYGMPEGCTRVEPHSVEGYTRSDGTEVRGYFRDGDGNTSDDSFFGYARRRRNK